MYSFFRCLLNLSQEHSINITFTVSARPTLERRSEMPVKVGQAVNVVGKKNSVTMYNHATRDTRDVSYGDKKIVFRDTQADEDAYSQAMKESILDTRRAPPCKNDSQRKMRDSRSKIALTKQNVEKEFKDTMAFLNSLPKDKSKPIVSTYLLIYILEFCSC